jgi:hypothetical protein
LIFEARQIAIVALLLLALAAFEILKCLGRTMILLLRVVLVRKIGDANAVSRQ